MHAHVHVHVHVLHDLLTIVLFTVEALACDSFYKSMGGHVWCETAPP